MRNAAGVAFAGHSKRTARLGRVALLCASSLIAVLFTAAPAHAATYTVNSTGDEGDASTADSLCLTAAGTCTLRAAIQQANAAAGADTISFAIAGEGPHTIQPTSTYTVTSPMTIDGYSQPGATQNTLATGTNATLKIEIDGRLFPGSFSIGFRFNSGSSGSAIRGLAVHSFQSRAIEIQTSSGSNFVQGNFLGTDVSGASRGALPQELGVVVFGPNNTIGGNAAERNLISGNLYGIYLSGSTSTGNVIKGNLIGTNAAGTAKLPGAHASGIGIAANSSANSNTIGGVGAGDGNVISGAGMYGMYLQRGTHSHVVKGNLIGTNAAGTGPVGNAIGLVFSESNNNIVGGTEAGAGNVISGSASSGVSINGSTGNVIRGNFIGTNAAGATTLGNGQQGIYLGSSSTGNTVGGSEPGAGNVIRNNGTHGIGMISTGVQNPILGNSISANGGLGIDLNMNGVNPNDAQDPDSGPNDLQNYPVLSTSPGSTAIGGNLNSTPNTPFRVEFFESAACDPSGYGEGVTYLGFRDVTTDANGNAQISATFPALAVGDVVTATATNPNAATSEFSACRTLEPTPSSDLAVTVDDGRTTARVGETLSYTVVVTNNGPSAANGSTLTDSLPASVTYQSSTCTSAGGASCAPHPPCANDGGVTCTIPTLPSGSSVTYTINVVPHTPGEIENSVSLAVPAGHEEPNLSNNTAKDNTTVVPSADLEVSQSDSPDPARLGQDVTYTVTIKNNGPSGATGVELTDNIPASTTFVSATPSQGSDCAHDAGEVTCAIGNLAKDATATVTIVVTPTETGGITNTASVDGNEADAVSSNDSDDEITTVDPSADLELTMTDSPDPVLVGQNVTYTITVTNHGPSTTTGVAVIHYIPSSFEFVSASSSQGKDCGFEAPYTVCELGTLAKDATATVTIVATPTETGEILTVAGVNNQGQEGPDPTPGNNIHFETTTVNDSSDLEVSQSDTPDPARLGQDVTYTVTIKNNGPSDATGVVLTDDIPASADFVSATPSQGTDCTHDAGEITCALGELAKDATATVTIVVTPTSSGDFTNTASVEGNEADPVSSNDSDDEKTTVNPSADLKLTMTDSPDPVLVGEDLTYTLSVTNDGPSTTTGVEVHHQLPASVDFVSATPSQGTCTPPAGVGSHTKCELGNLSKDAAATITIVGTPTGAGEVSSSASVSNSGLEGPDPTPSNNSVEEPTTVNASSDLEVTQSDTPDPVRVGQDLTYTVTIKNNGPSDATGVVLTDDIPASATFVSATPSQGADCTHDAGEITCALGNLAKDATATVTIVVTPTTPGGITNKASVDGNEADTMSTNDSDDETTTVNPSADLSVAQTDNRDPVRVGQELTYTVTIKNNGPSDATGVTFTDVFPSSADFSRVNILQSAECTSNETQLTCVLGDLAKDATATFEVTVVPKEAGEITNVASVDGNEVDATSTNDSSSETTLVKSTGPCGDDAEEWCTPDGDSDSDANGREIRVDEGSGEVIIRGNRNLIKIGPEFEGTVEAVGRYNSISGSARGDSITVNGCGNRVRGRGGRDMVTVDCPAPGGATVAVTAPNGDRTKVTNAVWGGSGADVIRNLGDRAALYGQVGADELVGGAFDDLIEGGDGNDTVRAGDGDDLVLGQGGRDDLNGGRGEDTLRGAAGADRLAGGANDDELFGGSGPDDLIGGPGNDSLDGGPKVDSCNGGGGRNTFTSC